MTLTHDQFDALVRALPADLQPVGAGLKHDEVTTTHYGDLIIGPISAAVARLLAEQREQRGVVQSIRVVLDAHQFDPAGPGLDASCHADDCGWTHPWDRPTHEMWEVHREHVAAEVTAAVEATIEAALRAAHRADPSTYNVWSRVDRAIREALA